jgi:protease I
MNELKNFRVAVLATDGFEESELIEPVRALRAAGAEVHVIAPHSGEIQGFKHFDKASKVAVDKTIDSVRAADYDGLLLPGGALNADAMRVEPKVLEFVRVFDDSDKPMAVICHAPWILISADLVRERILTSYHTIHDDLRNAGAYWVDQAVVVDHNLMTSRQPKDLPAFNREMIKLFTSANASIINIAESA